jgi:hypothetical protein
MKEEGRVLELKALIHICLQVVQYMYTAAEG